MEEQEDATAFTTGFEKKAGIPRWETGIFRWPRELLAEAKEGTGPYSALTRGIRGSNRSWLAFGLRRPRAQGYAEELTSIGKGTSTVGAAHWPFRTTLAHEEISPAERGRRGAGTRATGASTTAAAEGVVRREGKRFTTTGRVPNPVKLHSSPTKAGPSSKRSAISGPNNPLRHHNQGGVQGTCNRR